MKKKNIFFIFTFLITLSSCQVKLGKEKTSSYISSTSSSSLSSSSVEKETSLSPTKDSDSISSKESIDKDSSSSIDIDSSSVISTIDEYDEATTYNASDDVIGTYSEEHVVNNYHFISNVTSGSSWTIDTNNKTYNNMSFTKRIKSGGTGSYKSRMVKFYASEASTLTIYMMSSNSKTATSVELYDLNNNKVIQTIDSVVGISLSSYTLSIPSKGMYCFYSSGEKGINIFYMNLVHGGSSSSGGQSTPIDTTKSPVSNPDLIEVSPSATNKGTGVKEDPTSFMNAVLNVNEGGVIELTEGTYSFDSTFSISKDNSGSEGKYKTIKPKAGQKVIIDFTNQIEASSSRGISLAGSYWHIKDITIQNAGDNGMIVSGNNNIIEGCIFTGNADSGLQISRTDTSLNNIADWPSNNLIKNCTSYNNSDSTGENADGFAAKLTCGVGNVFDGCISYANSDDGWDLYQKEATGAIGAITLRNCLSMFNGYTFNGTKANGDCNGYKLGNDEGGIVNHIVENCIAYGNGNHGFTDNGDANITIRSCTSLNNSTIDGKKSNFDLKHSKTVTYSHNMSNLLSVSLDNTTSISTADKYAGTISNSIMLNASKKYFSKFTDSTTIDSAFDSSKVSGNEISNINASKVFVSSTFDSTYKTSDKLHELLRDENGNIALGDFLKVKDTSIANINNNIIGADLSSVDNYHIY